MGYLNGAVQAGLRAADEVTLQLRPQPQPQRGSQSSETAEEVGDGLLRALDGRKRQKETTCRGYEGSLIWTMGKLAVVAALVGFAMRKAWLAGGKINLPL